jgi:hypothetical protein
MFRKDSSYAINEPMSGRFSKAWNELFRVGTLAWFCRSWEISRDFINGYFARCCPLSAANEGGDKSYAFH